MPSASTRPSPRPCRRDGRWWPASARRPLALAVAQRLAITRSAASASSVRRDSVDRDLDGAPRFGVGAGAGFGLRSSDRSGDVGHGLAAAKASRRRRGHGCEADEEKPDLLVDLGTLTGAARVALGPDLPPFYTNDETLAQDVTRCAKQENDPLWRLPLAGATRPWSISKVATINNAPSGWSPAPSSARCSAAFRRSRQKLAACRHLRLDATGQTGAARRRRIPGCARDLRIIERTLWMIRA